MQGQINWRGCALRLALLLVLGWASAAQVGPAGAAGSFSTSASASPSTVAPGGSVSITASVTSFSASTALVDVEVYSSIGAKVFQRYWDNQGFVAGQARSYTAIWQVPASEGSGSYTVKIGIFRSGWAGLLTWNNGAATFSVGGASPTPTSVPPTATSTPTPVPPTATATAAPGSQGFTTSASASPSVVSPGDATDITVSVTSGAASTVLVDVEVYTPAGLRVFQQYWDNQGFAAGQLRSYTATWQVPASQAAGTYAIEVGIFNPGWAGTLNWTASAGQLTVSGAPATATPGATATPMATPGATATPTAVATGHFNTLPPGSALPSGAQCASLVRRSSWEPRPGNAPYNQTTGAAAGYSGGAVLDGMSTSWQQAATPRIDGNFSGTTDEIIQWGACKWGRDEDVVRATAAQESWWRQTTVGDGGQSFGLLQVRYTYHTGTFPYSANSTAFNVDYALAWWRGVYEGQSWLGTAPRGDDLGSGGVWYDGAYRDAGAQRYIDSVSGYLQSQPWIQPGF